MAIKKKLTVSFFNYHNTPDAYRVDIVESTLLNPLLFLS